MIFREETNLGKLMRYMGLWLLCLCDPVGSLCLVKVSIWDPVLSLGEQN